MPDYRPGTPSWVELSSPDPAASVAFYTELFGWDVTDPGPVEETGGYRMFTQDGRNISGLMQIMQENQPPFWSTYITVADADETAATVKAAGGSVHVEPMDVMDIGRMAFFGDPTGAVFGVWQPKTFTGADIVNTPNSHCWNEILTRDPDAAKAFYGDVFGWQARPAGFEGAGDYSVWFLDESGESGVGGMMPMSEPMFPAEIPPHWNVTFAIADADAIAARAAELGGRCDHGPADCPIGRFASLADPHGAFFNVIQLAEA